MKVHNYKIMLKVSLALYPAVNSNFSIVLGTLSTESGKSHLCLVVNNKNLNFFWHVCCLVRYCNFVLSVCLSRLGSFLSPWIYKLTNSATLWIAEGHTSCLWEEVMIDIVYGVLVHFSHITKFLVWGLFLVFLGFFFTLFKVTFFRVRGNYHWVCLPWWCHVKPFT